MGNRRHREHRKTHDSIYEKHVKRMIDKGLSFAGLVVLSPVYAAVALAVFADDPGAVLFTQKRVGKDKKFFVLHKFRTMKRCTPHDVPTHQLENPERYITRVGKFLRKYSLDELPQIWDIFIGNMSIIGPRPALWNQDDLVEERDKYGANGVLPGLTGWAQINGRDELEIAEKARLDGMYTEKLKQGGWKALFFDARCFAGTVLSVVRSKGVVEGGTGELRKNRKTKTVDVKAEADVGFADYGHLKHFDIDTSEKNKKRVLITGAGSYIGGSFERWAKEHYPVNFTIDTLDMRDPGWRGKDFSPYDAVLHVAGIVHVNAGKVSGKEYYAVNTDLAVETAKKAKADGVKQFVFMSSMSIYGDSVPFWKDKIINEHTVPSPRTFYGDSKWRADRGVRKLADGSFRVAILRPPMVYGKDCRGNYQMLAKLVKILPAFPDVKNIRSMLHIRHLCEFLCKLMLSGEGGVYFPQDGEYARTSEMARQIAEAAGKRIWMTKLLNPAVAVASHMPGRMSRLTNKAFGNLAYSKHLSIYAGLEYLEGNKKADKKPFVSIITVCFNSQATIRRTIESVLNQTSGNFEYLIIDGASSDRTLKIADEYRERFALRGIPYRIYSAKDNGIYDAMDKGIEKAEGDIIGIVNSDDWYEPSAVETAVRLHDRDHFDVCMCALNLWCRDKKWVKRPKIRTYKASRDFCHPSMFVTRDTYRRIGAYSRDQIFYGDFDFWLRLFKRDVKITVSNQVVTNYAIGGVSNQKTVLKMVMRIRERYKAYRDNNYSKLYFLESVFSEIAKMILA